MPYTVHPRHQLDDRPSQGRAFELLSGPRVKGAVGSYGSPEWELASGWHGRGASRANMSWQFDEVFGVDSSQDQIFDVAARDVVHGALDGYNGTLFAYGQTGSGKTYTIQGGDGYSKRGIIPRAIQAVFEEAARRSAAEQEQAAAEGIVWSGTTYKVSVSFCEIYNEGVYDLLETGASRNGPIETWPKVDMQVCACSLSQAEPDQIPACALSRRTEPTACLRLVASSPHKPSARLSRSGGRRWHAAFKGAAHLPGGRSGGSAQSIFPRSVVGKLTTRLVTTPNFFRWHAMPLARMRILVIRDPAKLCGLPTTV